MNRAEVNQVLKAVKGFFPTMTQDQGRLIAERIGGSYYGRTLAVVKTHAASHEFLSLPQLLEGLRSDAAAHRRRQSNEEKIIDWLKADAYRNGCLLAENDPSILYEHFTGAWTMVRDDMAASEYERQTARKLIFAHSRMAFSQIGFSDAESMTAAEYCVDLESGNRVVVPAAAVGDIAATF